MNGDSRLIHRPKYELTSRQSTEKSLNKFFWTHILESKEDLWVAIQWVNTSEFISNIITCVSISNLNSFVKSWFFRIVWTTYGRWTMFDSVVHKFWEWVISKSASIIIWLVGCFQGLDSRELNNGSCWSICPWISEFVLDEITTPGHGFCELSSVTLFPGQISSFEVK